MKSTKLLNFALAISAIGTVDTPKIQLKFQTKTAKRSAPEQNMPVKMTENLQKAVLKDVQEIRQVRHYKNSNLKDNKEYDTKVLKTVKCFDTVKQISEKLKGFVS